ncbi:MAG: cyanophycinase [Planctomycetota bacterium]
MKPFLGLVLSLAACAAPGAERARSGLVVAVGGGGTPPEVIAHVAALAGGAGARVLVLPQASEVNDGQASAALWLEQGAGAASVLSDLAAPDAAARIADANVIWMPGGDQTRLMERLGAAGLVEAVRSAHAGGAIVGGTSAGAAVLSRVMISGKPDPGALRGGAMEALEGLGAIPWAIVDQHFVERERLSRLLTAVLDHPDLIGIGISEGTAALVDGRAFTVMGRGQVTVFDARGARVTAAEPGEHQAAQGVVLHVVKPGEALRLPEARGASRH